MAKGSTSTQAPPPSVQAGFVKPGEVAAFPQGTQTKVGEAWGAFGAGLSKANLGASPGAGMQSGREAFGLENLPGLALDPSAFTIPKRQVNFGRSSTAALRSLNTLNI